jgi:2,3-bisphosphoglycerate-independent phosphoglycerate mutase
MLWDTVHDQPHTAHTLNPVPIVFCGEGLLGQQLRPHGVLADVAPTLLQLLDLPQPELMTARSLFT